MKKPKDLGIKVVPKEQALWEKVKNEALMLIEQSENNLIIQRAMLRLAEERIMEEQDKRDGSGKDK